MTSGIYKITNLVNGKVYIGSAVNLERRKSQHFSDLRKDKHRNPHLQASFNKYDEGSFKFSVINTVLFKTDLIRQEQRLIDYYSKILGWDNMYNLCPTAASSLGLKLSDEHRKKLSLAKKGKTLSEEHRKKLSEAGKGKPRSDATKKKISKAMKGKTFSEESRRKLSEANKGNAYSSKPVEATCIKTGLVTEFDSATEAVNQWPGANHRLISDCCLGKRNKHFQHYWKFTNQPPISMPSK